MLCAGLQEAGHEVHTAVDGPSALATLEEFQPDLISLDVEMPDMTGFEVCEKLREREYETGKTPPIPVVFVTGNDTLKNRELGFELGALDFITKNIGQEKLVSKIQDSLAIRTPLTGLNALVVDDSDVARHVITRCLRAEGLNVIEAENGAVALKIAEERENDLDLIVTDVVMPEMNGDELCRRLRQINGLKYVPIIFISGLPEKDTILELFRAGGTDHIIKPFAKEELLAHIRAHMQVRQLNRTLESQVAELSRLNKLKTDLLAITSHDLRSPLNGILATADLLDNEPDLDDTHREYVGMITESGEKLLALIGDLLDLAKIEAQTETHIDKPLSIVSVMQSLLPPFDQQASKKNIELEFHNKFENTSPNILGDESELNRIFNNLISNALKFTPQEGKVSISVEPGQDSEISISVADTGIGISQDNIPRLFDRFSGASRPGTEGEASTGLGLSIVKDLVRRHVGRIEVESEIGKGTTFFIFFPLQSQS